jgi:NTF2-related export protein 1/2
LREQINEAARVADEFTKLYYDHLDKKKPMQRLYLDQQALLVYNGNGVNGSEEIGKFLHDLPSTETSLTTLDAQPIVDSLAGAKTYLIQTSGTVKIESQKSRAFQQSFLITAQDTKWKIVSDTFRLQDGICNENLRL